MVRPLLSSLNCSITPNLPNQVGKCELFPRFCCLNCVTPVGVDSKKPGTLQTSHARLLCNSNSNHFFDISSVSSRIFWPFGAWVSRLHISGGCSAWNSAEPNSGRRGIGAACPSRPSRLLGTAISMDLCHFWHHVDVIYMTCIYIDANL